MLFTTLESSEYNFCPETNTSIRHKKSGGSGQNVVHPEASCVFVKEYLNPYLHKVVVGYLDGSQIIPIDTVADAGGNKIGIVAIHKRTGQMSLHKVYLSPRIGLRPYEWLPNIRHIGNVIVSIEP
tara:strand:+ start:134 stop:508 length:375 start_codon:yes stop_codon:yes gene_type:complete